MAEVGKVEYKVELNDSDVGKQASKTESTLLSKFGGAAKKVGAAALSASAAVVTGATAAVTALTKQAVTAYSEYEQLVGGVETLFGTGGKTLEEYAESIGKSTDEAKSKFDDLEVAQARVFENANIAFMTAGMSANQYMDTVTSFSASLIQSLGGDTKKAADLADQAIIDMADNANKMGSSLESIQTAYQGFAKQNYTMLDNLKLGYGGTKEEMARLIEDASKMTAEQEKLGVTVDKSSLSFANIVSAISVMQEHLGIAGTTANEAATTIAGSIGMVKASWENVIAAIGEGDDFKLNAFIDDLVSSIETAANNILPVVEKALSGVAQLVSTMAPVIAEKLPAMISDALPKLLQGGAEAIKALADGLLQAIPSLMPTVLDIIKQLAEMIISMAPDIVQCGIELIVDLAMGLADALPTLIPMAVDAVLTIVDTLLDNIDMLIDAALALIMALADGLLNALPKLIEKAPEIIIKLVEALIRNYPKVLQAGVELIMKLLDGIIQSWAKVFEVGRQIVDKVKSGFSGKVNEAKNWGRDMIQNFIDGVMAKFDALKNSVKRCAQAVKDFLGFSVPKEGPLHDANTYAPDMMELYAKGIDDNIDLVKNSLSDVATSIAGTLDVGYNLPDIAGYAADLAANITASSATEIVVPLSVDGREIARASAWYMNEQLAWEAR